MSTTDIAMYIVLWILGSAAWDYILFKYYPWMLPKSREYTERRGW